MGIHTFKAGSKQYEIFIAEDHIEVYEKEDPSEGFIFDSKKQLIAFVNHLTDMLDEEIK